MSDPDEGPADDPLDDHGSNPALDEVRQAAGAVVASLKWLIDATEKVIEDPEAFAQVVDSGRSVVEAFAGGFVGGHDPGFPSPDEEADRDDEAADREAEQRPDGPADS